MDNHTGQYGDHDDQNDSYNPDPSATTTHGADHTPTGSEPQSDASDSIASLASQAVDKLRREAEQRETTIRELLTTAKTSYDDSAELNRQLKESRKTLADSVEELHRTQGVSKDVIAQALDISVITLNRTISPSRNTRNARSSRRSKKTDQSES